MKAEVENALGNDDAAKVALNQVRDRVNLDPVRATGKELRDAIRLERRLELALEGNRLFDLRRWMDAPVEENKRVYGLNVFQTVQNKDEFMQVIPVYNLSATFTDKMYFWPISHSELKRNKALTQNPGWKYND